MHDRRMVGARGEDLAASYLQEHGFDIVERNVRLGLGEIDIVAWDGPVLVFVEVRSRRSQRWGTPLESVNHRKQQKLIQCARAFLVRRQLYDVHCRFDVVGITWNGPGREPQIHHVRDAFSVT